jgi:lipoprotein-anchoring transpeptidase ErfK/SrfK
MPASIQFHSIVTDAAYRKKIEQAVSVTTSSKVEGSWGWLDNRQLIWCPKEFCSPGTTVTTKAPLPGFRAGEDKRVAEDLSGSVTIGRQQLSRVDIDKHQMTVTRDGATVKTFPASSGNKCEPGYYKVDTNFNVRMTWTGEFVHSAPWSVGAQGSTNVSHGCVNMAPSAAEWFFDNSIPGDPVDFEGSSREFKPSEGIGVWQYGYAQWQQQSALG